MRTVDLLFWQGVPITRGTLPVDAIELFLSQVAGEHFLDLARSLCCIKARQSAAAASRGPRVLVTWFCHHQALGLRAAPHSTAQQCSTKDGNRTSQHITSHFGTFWTNICKDGKPHDGTTLRTVRTTRRAALCKGVDVAISPGTGESWILAGGVSIRHLCRGFIWSQAA